MSVRELPSKDLGGKIVPLLAAQRTLCGDPGIRHRANGRRDVFTAFLAADREVAVPSLWKVEHECQYRRTKGETAMWISSELNSGKIVEMCREGVGSLISMVYGEAC
jgi:hypothetical protein